MAKISTYATVAPTSTDKVIGTDTDNSSATKNFTIQGIADFAALGGYVYARYNYVTSAAATSTAVVGDYIFITVGTHVCTLPTAVAMAGKIIGVIVTVATAGGATVSVDTTAGQTINGAATQPLATQFTSYTFISDGTNWFIAN
tara:strand:- start:1835 stop:2266 length:432 start_codon:yes stop_codon:yes gene_type:complete